MGLIACSMGSRAHLTEDCQRLWLVCSTAVVGVQEGEVELGSKTLSTGQSLLSGLCPTRRSPSAVDAAMQDGPCGIPTEGCRCPALQWKAWALCKQGLQQAQQLSCPGPTRV